MKKVFCIFAVVLILIMATVPCFAFIGTISNETDVTFTISLDGLNYFDLLPSSSYPQEDSSIYDLYVLVPDYTDSIYIRITSTLGTNFSVLNCSFEQTSTDRVYRFFDFIDSYFIIHQGNSGVRLFAFTGYTSVFYKPLLDFHSSVIGHSFDYFSNLFTSWAPASIFVFGIIFVCFMIFVIFLIIRRCRI